MPSKTLTRRTAALVLAAAVCGAQAASLPAPIAADPDFHYLTERDLWVQITVHDLAGNPAGRRSVEVLAAQDPAGTRLHLVDKGLTDLGGGFERKVRVPARAASVTVRVGVLGIDNTVTLAIDGSGTLTYRFE